jgi:hypothetical protein
LVEDSQHGVVGFDRDGRAGVAEVRLHALLDDLDAAAAGNPPLDPDRGVGQGGWRTGDPGAAQSGPLVRSQGERQGAPQLPVDDDVQQGRLQAQRDQPAGQRHSDEHLPVREHDRALGLHPAGRARRLRHWRAARVRAGRWRSGGASAVVAQPG